MSIAKTVRQNFRQSALWESSKHAVDSRQSFLCAVSGSFYALSLELSIHRLQKFLCTVSRICYALSLELSLRCLQNLLCTVARAFFAPSPKLAAGIYKIFDASYPKIPQNPEILPLFLTVFSIQEKTAL